MRENVPIVAWSNLIFKECLMQKLLLVLIALSFLLFSGCQTNETAESPSPETSASEPPAGDSASKQAFYTIEDVKHTFLQSEAGKTARVTDCVLAPDGAYGLIGVVQYTDKDGNPINLSFVKEGFSQPIGVDLGGPSIIAEDSVLTYLGDGKVTFVLLDTNTGKLFDYVISYSKSDDKHTHFVMAETERK